MTSLRELYKKHHDQLKLLKQYLENTDLSFVDQKKIFIEIAQIERRLHEIEKQAVIHQNAIIPEYEFIYQSKMNHGKNKP